MNKKRLSSLLCSILAFVLAFSTLSACGKPDGEQADPNKTQLYISHYNGGVGKAWLDKIETDFQNEYADWVNPNDPSKVGVQIIVNNHKNEGQNLADDLLGNRDEIFFTDKSAYYEMLAEDKLLDITSVLTDDNTDGKQILSKLTDTQKAYYSYGDDQHYFALPHYESFGGITYNKKLWDQQNLYFAKGGCPSEYSTFVQNNNNGKEVASKDKPAGYDDNDPETWIYVGVDGVEDFFDPDNPITYGLSAGPDGVYGTYDDGLPATYAEFFALCDHMLEFKQTTPFIWSGKLGQYYFKYILNALLADHDGKDMIELSYNFNGTAKKLITNVNDDGTLEYEKNVTITTNNGYKMFFTEGTYYALTFIEKMLSNPDYYSDNLEAEGTHYHINAQREFVLSQFDKAKYNKDNKYIAMLIEGNYWENEARDAGVFDKLSSYGKTVDDVSYANLPMPKVNEDYIGNPTTVMEYQQNIAFIKSNISSDKVNLAKDFLKFCYTDEKLQEFTALTGVTKGLNYSLDGIDGTGLTDYAKSLIDMKKHGDMAYMVSGNSAFTDHQSYFEYRFATNSYTYVLDAMKSHHWSAKNVFDGIKEYRTQTSWNKNILGK